MERLLELLAIQLRVQPAIQVEIQVAIQVQTRVSTQASTRLRTLLPVLPSEHRWILRETQARLRFDAGLQRFLLLTPTLSSKRRGRKAGIRVHQCLSVVGWTATLGDRAPGFLGSGRV
jgi:hypothetical protein